MTLEINQSTAVEIFAGQYWNNTQIYFEPGQHYRFEAHGTWKDLTVECDADGYTNAYMRLFDRLKRAREYHWFALMGSVGQSGLFPDREIW